MKILPAGGPEKLKQYVKKGRWFPAGSCDWKKETSDTGGSL